MPATPTGRGAQVIVDPGSLTAKAIRGSYASTMEGNLAKVRSDRLAGTFASGDTTLDGTTTTGGRATDGAVVPGGSGLPRLLNPVVASVGNGADTTEDTLQTVVIPANTLLNVGDVIRVRAGGTMAASTDTKNVRVRMNGVIFAAVGGSTAVGVTWSVWIDLQKNGSNAQWSTALGVAQQQVVGTQSVVGTLVDTAPITLLVTGQNSSNSVANSIVCRYLTVEYAPA